MKKTMIRGQYKRRDEEKDMGGQKDRNRLNEKNLASQMNRFDLKLRNEDKSRTKIGWDLFGDTSSLITFMNASVRSKIILPISATTNTSSNVSHQNICYTCFTQQHRS